MKTGITDLEALEQLARLCLIQTPSQSRDPAESDGAQTCTTRSDVMLISDTSASDGNMSRGGSTRAGSACGDDESSRQIQAAISHHVLQDKYCAEYGAGQDVDVADGKQTGNQTASIPSAGGFVVLGHPASALTSTTPLPAPSPHAIDVEPLPSPHTPSILSLTAGRGQQGFSSRVAALEVEVHGAAQGVVQGDQPDTPCQTLAVGANPLTQGLRGMHGRGLLERIGKLEALFGLSPASGANLPARLNALEAALWDA